MSNLAARAAAAAGRTTIPTVQHGLDLTGPAAADAEQIRAAAASSWDAVETTAPVSGPPADIDLGASPDDYDQVPVHVAWMRVMTEVREIRKTGTVNVGGGYSFRGVDTVMNVFGAAQRKHGVIVMPYDSTIRTREVAARSGTLQEATVEVKYRIYGPKGDYLEAAASGAALDSGDKASAKAQSVALRILLLQAGMVPTEARDPDLDVYERGTPEPSPQDYANEALNPETSKARLRTIYTEANRARQLGVEVMDGEMQPVTLGELIKSVGSSRD